MKRFGFKKLENRNRKRYLRRINLAYIFLLFFCFSLFAFYEKVTNFLFTESKIDIFMEDLEEISFYFWNFDKDLSHILLTMDDVVQSYASWDNVLLDKSQEIDQVRDYMRKNKDYLAKLWFSNYDAIMDFGSDIFKHKEEVFTLLGSKEEQNYLVILQNTNEKRPNWWFFGSFAFVSLLGGHIKKLEIIDAYYPNYIANKTFLQAPYWSSAFLPEQRIWFIASNKFWFTDIDGKNIKTLYERMMNEDYDMKKVKEKLEPHQYETLLNKNIRWVIFVRSDAFEALLPWFKEKIWEREFLNASIDLIRWESRGNKKEMYIHEVNDYFNQHSTDIVKNFVEHFDKVLKNNYVQIYLSSVSTGMNEFLLQNNLMNVFSDHKIYARDTNNSFDKVDGFVDKDIQIFNAIWIDVLETHNDIVNIEDLKPGVYTMKITYTLDVPKYYYDFIAGLEKKYSIKIEDRERWILALNPAQYAPQYPEKRRESKATLYFPLQIDLLDSHWEYMEQRYFKAPFANGMYYKMRINENHTSKWLEIKFQVK